MRVALFGTSADPPHMGHQNILRTLARDFDRVAVWAADNPYKSNQSPMAVRAKMLSLLIASLPPVEGRSHSHVELVQSLSDRYSINSIVRAQKRWPKAQMSFVVGSDLLAQLPKWYQAKEIFKRVDILVFPRPGYPTQGPALSALRQVATVNIATPDDEVDISSSTFRASRCDPNPHAQTIPAVIRDYIRAHDLYPCPQETSQPQVLTRP